LASPRQRQYFVLRAQKIFVESRDLSILYNGVRRHRVYHFSGHGSAR
jgi:hypothetical protein